MQKVKVDQRDILPVDRGWAWVVVFASFALFSLGAGGFKIQGVILVELIEKFDGVYSPSTLLWVFLASPILGCMLSPVTGMIIVRWGYRVAASIGVLGTALGHIGIAYAFDLPALLTFHTLPAGVGAIPLIMTAILASGPYFEKRKALAIGLVAAGSGVGAFILPNILRSLFDNMNFSGALLLYGGFNLQYLYFAALLRPMSYYEELYTKQLNQLPENSEELPSHAINGDAYNSNSNVVDVYNANCGSDTETFAPAVRERNTTFHHPDNILNSIHGSITDKKHCSMPQLHGDQKSDEGPNNILKIIRTAGSTKHVNSIGVFTGSEPFIGSGSANEPNTDEGPNNTELAKERFNWKIILMPKFIMLCISTMVAILANGVVYACVPALGKESGISKETVAMVMSIAGGLEIPCRISNGLIADRKLISATAQYALCLFGVGIFSLLCAILQGLPGVVLVLVGMASMGTSVFSLLPVVLRELIGSENVTTGMGIQNASQAIPLIITSYVTGGIYDASGTWRMVFFYIAGSAILGSVVTWPYLLLKFCNERRQPRQPNL